MIMSHCPRCPGLLVRVFGVMPQVIMFNSFNSWSFHHSGGVSKQSSLEYNLLNRWVNLIYLEKDRFDKWPFLFHDNEASSLLHLEQNQLTSITQNSKSLQAGVHPSCLNLIFIDLIWKLFDLSGHNFDFLMFSCLDVHLLPQARC